MREGRSDRERMNQVHPPGVTAEPKIPGTLDTPSSLLDNLLPTTDQVHTVFTACLCKTEPTSYQQVRSLGHPVPGVPRPVVFPGQDNELGSVSLVQLGRLKHIQLAPKTGSDVTTQQSKHVDSRCCEVLLTFSPLALKECAESWVLLYQPSGSGA